MDAMAIANDINKVITSKKQSSIYRKDTTNDFFPQLLLFLFESTLYLFYDNDNKI